MNIDEKIKTRELESRKINGDDATRGLSIITCTHVSTYKLQKEDLC